MALGLDGVVTGTATATSKAVSLTTSVANSRIFVAVTCNGGPVVSVTASGLTFTRRARNVNGGINLELWSAPATGTLSSLSITVTQTSSAFLSVHAFGISNGGATPSFDTNGALPNLVQDGNGGSGGATTTRASITTSQTNDLLISVYRFLSTSAPTNPGTGWTQISSANFMECQYKIVSAPQTATDALLSTGFNGGNNDQNGGIGDAVTSDAIEADIVASMSVGLTEAATVSLGSINAGTSTLGLSVSAVVQATANKQPVCCVIT
jgi:hypothetical protein